MKLRKLDGRGEGYIDVVVITVTVGLAISIVISILPVFVAKYDLDLFANEILREAEISGATGTAGYAARYAQMAAQTGLSPSMSFAGTQYGSGGRVQLGGNIVVTARVTVHIGTGYIGRIPISLTAKCTGKSEVYYK